MIRCLKVKWTINSLWMSDSGNWTGTVNTSKNNIDIHITTAHIERTYAYNTRGLFNSFFVQPVLKYVSRIALWWRTDTDLFAHGSIQHLDCKLLWIKAFAQCPKCKCKFGFLNRRILCLVFKKKSKSSICSDGMEVCFEL